MDDSQRIVKCGALSLHSQGGFFKRRWLSKYLVLYDGSKSGIKRLELFDSEIKFKKQNPAKIIPLVDCIRVVTCQRGHKTSYTFEVRTSEQFYLLAAQSFPEMNDWVNCLRLVAFGQPLAASTATAATPQGSVIANNPSKLRNSQLPSTPQLVKSAQQQHRTQSQGSDLNARRTIDILLDKHRLTASQSHASELAAKPPEPLTASQAAVAAATANAKARQRQPSLLGSCKPQPPQDSPFIAAAAVQSPIQQHSGPSSLQDHQIKTLNQTNSRTRNNNLLTSHNPNTLTPSVRGQLITSATSAQLASNPCSQSDTVASSGPVKSPLVTQQQQTATNRFIGMSALNQNQNQGSNKRASLQQQTLDEEEENMLYCSIEDNPSEHNYRVKVIETELSLRCQLKCYQLTAPKTIDQQYEQLPAHQNKQRDTKQHPQQALEHPMQMVTFYQLIIGPQELTLLNDYATFKPSSVQQQQGLWSWPYQCIRRYGFDKDNCFMFEAGRKCTSGPGQFIVQTPKAYSIYQDVVKFVNELRSLTTHSTTSVSGSMSHNQNINGDFSTSTSQITHIPVNWNPDSSTVVVAQQDNQSATTSNEHSASATQAIPSIEPVSTKKFCDNRLTKQNDSFERRKTPPQVPAKPSALSLSKQSLFPKRMQQEKQQHQQPKLIKCDTFTNLASLSDRDTDEKSCSSSPVTSRSAFLAGASKSSSDFHCLTRSPEETDESGYEGAETTTSKATIANQTKRINPDCSTTASAQNSNAIEAKMNHDNNDQHNDKNSARSRLLGYNGDSNNDKGPGLPQKQGTLAATNSKQAGSHIPNDPRRQQHDDFEASLIRDVYCEISKLHATFAVVANDDSTGEDCSMSSRSGSSSMTTNSCSASMENNTNNNSNNNNPMIPNNAPSSSPSDRSYDQIDKTINDQPTYTNLAQKQQRKPNSPMMQGKIAQKMLNNDLTSKASSLCDSRSPSHTSGASSSSSSSSSSLSSYDVTYDIEASPNNRQECLNASTNTSNNNNKNNSSNININNNNNNNNNPAANKTINYRQQLPLLPPTHALDELDPNYSVVTSPVNRMCHPMYLGSMLNPIPEAGEPQGNVNGTLAGARDQLIKQKLIPGGHNNPRSHPIGRDKGKLQQVTNKPTYRQATNNSKTLQPNRHYLINDVQYAKISRNK